MDVRLVQFAERHLQAFEGMLDDPDVKRFTRLPVPKPPGFPRMSSTIPVAPACLAARIALSTSLAEPAENSSSRRSASVVPGTIAHDTAGTVTFSRTML